MSLLAAILVGGCTNTEEPVTDEAAEAIEVNAGIAEATRAVIGGGYTNDLEASFARWIIPVQLALRGPLSTQSVQVVRVIRR